ncbi:hypothetical protein EYR36_007276 [Pleurotus pulmonarius]|nr:hypothetical protein EYR36_007276 [Pleurotus pulmonarius]
MLENVSKSKEQLRSAEDVLSERNLQGGVEEETKTSVTKALVQLRDAQEKIGEWRAEDARREQEARDAEAAAERKEAHARAMRKLEAQAAEARRRAAQNKAQAAAEGSRASTSPSKSEVAVPEDTIELNTDGEEEDTLPRIGKRRDRKGKREEPGTPTTPRRRLRRRGNTRPMAETSDAEGKAGERSESVAEPGLPTDVSVYGEYDPSVPGSHPRSLEWGCGADAAKNKPCPHPEVQFTGARRCLHCQSANSDCVGSGCRACAACRSRKSTCSFVKSRRRKVAGGEASGSGGAGIREVGTGVRGRRRRTPGTAARETPQATRASTTATALPILRPSHVDRELRDLHQTLANLESRAAALNAAQAELNRIRTATLANLGAAILRREQQWAEAADLAEREENDGADEGEEEIDEDGAEWYA